MIRILFVILSAIFLSSCALFTPVKSGVSARYVLDSLPAPTTDSHSGATILVNAMSSDPIYNTQQIAYTTRPYQISYYAKNRWAATPPQMLHPLIVQSLQNTHHFHAVITPLSMGRYDYVLNTQLLELRQIFFRNCSEVHLTVRAQILSAGTNNVVATKVISVVVVAPQNSPVGGVYAANRATAQMLAQLVQFSLQI